MRILFLVSLCIPAVCSAQPSFFEYLRNLGKSECESYLYSGDATMNLSDKAANEADWKLAFEYDDVAFEYYLLAFGHCDQEPKNQEKALSRLDSAQIHEKLLNCVYYITDAKDSFAR